jgi:hypothetical protein
MKKIIFVIVTLFSFTVNSQSNFDNVIVPKKLSFLSEENKYNLNETIKSFFTTEGFNTYFDTDVLPVALANKRCNAMFVDVIENNTAFTTKVNVIIKDCQNNILITSSEGISRSKELQKAYLEAIRMALNSIRERLNITNAFVDVETNGLDVQTINYSVVKASSFTYNTKVNGNKVDVVNEAGGIVLELLKTSVNGIYIAKRMEQNGVFLKKGDAYFFEYYLDAKLVSERLDVNF